MHIVIIKHAQIRGISIENTGGKIKKRPKIFIRHNTTEQHEIP
jgi:hypothetical protein